MDALQRRPLRVAPPHQDKNAKLAIGVHLRVLVVAITHYGTLVQWYYSMVVPSNYSALMDTLPSLGGDVKSSKVILVLNR